MHEKVDSSFLELLFATMYPRLSDSVTHGGSEAKASCLLGPGGACLSSQSGRQRQEGQRNSGPLWDTKPYLHPIQQ